MSMRPASALLAAALALLGSCAPAPRFPAQGTLLGQRVSTTVDSALARYALEWGTERATEREAARAGRSDPALDARMAEVKAAADARELDWETLRRVAEQTSPDFATLYFIGRIGANPRFSRLQARYDAEFECIKGIRHCPPSPERDRVRALRGGYRLLFVGGFHYKSDPATGADFARPRETLARYGYDTRLLDLDEDGIIEENAARIARDVRREPGDKDLILVSTSTGGPETAYALGKLLPEPEQRRVRAWVSIGGMLRGTLIADDAMRWPKRWIMRLALWWLDTGSQGVPSMTVAARRKAFDELRFPRRLLTIQYVGAPLSGQVSVYARDRYEALRPYGPNDGLTLLADELIPGGYPLVQVGMDHFFRDPDMDLRAVALANVVIAELNGL